MPQYLVLTVLGGYSGQSPLRLSKAIRDCGGNITSSRMVRLGSEFSMLLLVSGSWDSIAKLEDSLSRLEKELDMRIQYKRSQEQPTAEGGMPYAIDVVCTDRPGVVHDISRFMFEHEIEIRDLYTSTYQPAQSNTTMFSLHISVNVPTDASIAALRGEFMDFCDRLNLDAIMEPAK